MLKALLIFQFSGIIIMRSINFLIFLLMFFQLYSAPPVHPSKKAYGCPRYWNNKKLRFRHPASLYVLARASYLDHVKSTVEAASVITVVRTTLLLHIKFPFKDLKVQDIKTTALLNGDGFVLFVSQDRGWFLMYHSFSWSWQRL